MKRLIKMTSNELKELFRRAKLGPILLPLYKDEVFLITIFYLLVYVLHKNKLLPPEVPFVVTFFAIPILIPLTLCRIEIDHLPLYRKLRSELYGLIKAREWLRIGPIFVPMGKGISVVSVIKVIQWSRLKEGPLRKLKLLETLCEKERTRKRIKMQKQAQEMINNLIKHKHDQQEQDINSSL
uniref:hypothetical protein n=1 Tax=Kroppenstedtia sanguinis TaxID=1380684 RepID=UPI003D2344AF